MNLQTMLNTYSEEGITPEEYLLVYLTFLAQEEEGKAEYLNQWFKAGGNCRLKELFESLKEKGVILKNYSPESFSPNNIEFNKNFIKRWFKRSRTMGKELFDAYPSFLQMNGKHVPLRSISKKFNNLDEFFYAYASSISHDVKKHTEILNILNWANKNDLINFGILSFVIDQKWNDLETIKRRGSVGNIANSLYTE